jgi:hypothetical protein
VELEAFGWMRSQRKTFWVSPEHEAALRGFVAFRNRFIRFFGALLMVEALIALAGVVVREVWVSCAAIVAIGFTIVAFPFATQAAVNQLGMRRASNVARASGIVVIALGVASFSLWFIRHRT